MTHASPFMLSVFLLVSILVVFPLAPRLLPPKTLTAIPDDLALFHRAILSSSSAKPTPSAADSYFFCRRPVPKVAFLFLTNSDLFFSPLWDKFFRGHHHLLNLYVHVHADSYSVLELPPMPSFCGRFVPAKATQRAFPTLISAARRLLAIALLDDPSNQFFGGWCSRWRSWRHRWGRMGREISSIWDQICSASKAGTVRRLGSGGGYVGEKWASEEWRCFEAALVAATRSADGGEVESRVGVAQPLQRHLALLRVERLVQIHRHCRGPC